jgi:hypothetical protein
MYAASTEIRPSPPQGRGWSALAAVLVSLGRLGLDAVYPPTCLSCRASTAQTGALCPTCWGQMRFIERPFCERLGTPFEQDLGPGLLSPQAIADPPVFARARAVARFEDGPARQLMHRLKYSDRAELAGPMGRWMARAGADILAGADALAPVPLHRCAFGHDVSTRPRRWPRPSGGKPARPADPSFWPASKRRRARSGLAAPSGRRMSRAHFGSLRKLAPS